MSIHGVSRIREVKRKMIRIIDSDSDSDDSDIIKVSDFYQPRNCYSEGGIGSIGITGPTGPRGPKGDIGPGFDEIELVNASQEMTTEINRINTVYNSSFPTAPLVFISLNSTDEYFGERFKHAYTMNINNTSFDTDVYMKYALREVLVNLSGLNDSPPSIGLLADNTIGMLYISSTNAKTVNFATNKSEDGESYWNYNNIFNTSNLITSDWLLLTTNNPGFAWVDDNPLGNNAYFYSSTNKYGIINSWNNYFVRSGILIGDLSATVLATGMPAIVTDDSEYNAMIYSYCDLPDGSGTWTNVTLPQPPNILAQPASLMVNPDGCPCLFYINLSDNYSLNYLGSEDSSGINGSWTINNRVDTGIIRFTSIIRGVNLPVGKIGVSYYKGSDSGVFFAVNDSPDGSGAWTIYNFDNINFGYLESSRTFPISLPNKNVGIIYHDPTTKTPKFALSNGTDYTNWVITTIDNVTLKDVGKSPYITLLSNGYILGIYLMNKSILPDDNDSIVYFRSAIKNDIVITGSTSFQITYAIKE